MPYRSRHSRHERIKRQDRFGTILIGVVIAAILIAVVFFIYSNLSKTKIDKETLCPQEGPSALTVILFDRSDPLNVVQQEALRRDLNGIKQELSPQEKLVIYLVNDTGVELLRPMFTMCNPGAGQNVNPFYENRELIFKKWHDGFSAKVDNVLEQMFRPSIAPYSQIMESIQSVAVTDLKSHRNIPKRLIIVSDMIHNTPEHSQYRGIVPFNEFKQSPYFRKIQAHLDGTEVMIFYVYRSGSGSKYGEKHVEFWRQYFYQQGGRLTRVIALEGAN